MCVIFYLFCEPVTVIIMNLKRLIAEGNLALVIERLIEDAPVVSKEVELQILTVSNWYNRVKRDERLTGSNFSEEYQKIVKATIEIIDEIEKKQVNVEGLVNGKIVFERNIRIALLPIPSLNNRIKSFRLRHNSKASSKTIRLYLPNRDVDLEFDCPVDIKIGALKELIISHFNLDIYTEHNSLIELRRLLSFNNSVLFNEDQLLPFDGVVA